MKKILALIILVSVSTNLSAKRSKSKPKQSSSPAFNVAKLSSKFSSWGINPSNNVSSINLLEAWKQYKKKKDIVVAVIDTGIDPVHPFLLNNIHVNGQVSHTKSNFGMDFSKGNKGKSTPTDDHGHGTHVSGIIKSVYPGVKLLVLKYYDPKASGQDNLNSTIEALKYAVKMNVDVINYSGGGPEPALQELKVLRQAQRKNILVVAAAGNEESNIDKKKFAYYPASYGLDNIISVTAHDQNAKILASSNYGPQSVDISAPGFRIRSAMPNARAGYLTGTSQATAFVTGVAALLKSQFPELKPTDIKSIIRKSAAQTDGYKKYCISGGRLDASSALKLARKWKAEGKRSVANIKELFNRKHEAPGKIFYRKVN